MLRDFPEFESLCKTKVEIDLKNSQIFSRQITNFILLILLQIFVQVLILIIFSFRMVKSERKLPKIFLHSLTKDQIFRNGSTDELFHFLSEKRFPYSSNASDYLVYCKSFFIPIKSHLEVTRSFSLYLIIHCFSRQRILGLSKTMIKFMAIILRKKIGLTLKPRYFIYYFLEFCTWTKVTSDSKIQFITTQSSYKNLPIQFYLHKINLERHMMWYSANSIPIRKIGETDSEIVLPQSLSTFIDSHLVWDDFQVGFLEKQGVLNSKVYGSMLFYPKYIQKNFNINSSLIYFDVVPQNLFETSFYSTEMALSNLEGIISVMNEYNDKFGKNLKLKVKHKRNPNKHHSAIYLKKVKRLIDCGAIETISPSVNLYTLINESKFVIGTPYTSPIIIAKELGVKCSFVCLSPAGYSIPDDFNEVLVIKDKDKLLNKLIEVI